MDNYSDLPQDDDLELSEAASRKPAMADVIQALHSLRGEILPSVVHYGLSDISAEDLETFRAAWVQFEEDLRRKIVTELIETSENDFSLDYRELGLLALDDPASSVRAAAIDLLWVDESLPLMERLMDLVQTDESSVVRAAAASGLGRFVLLGEFEDIPARAASQVQETLISLWTDTTEEVEVRRRALEALSNSSHEIVNEAIQEAYESGEYWFRVSAVFAMGRSAERFWKDIVLQELSSPEPELRFEAARAAGELTLSEAVKRLGKLAFDEDRETRYAAIWSLGEIGGREANRILSALAEDADSSDDEDLREAIEDAIANASLVGEPLEIEDDDEGDDQD